jgi:hypothetical protein
MLTQVHHQGVNACDNILHPACIAPMALGGEVDHAQHGATTTIRALHINQGAWPQGACVTGAMVGAHAPRQAHAAGERKAATHNADTIDGADDAINRHATEIAAHNLHVG